MYLLFLLSYFTSALVSDFPGQQLQSQIDIQDDRLGELDNYWIQVASAAAAGDIEAMKAHYHPDAVLVKPDTTISVTEAFRYRWKKEIFEVRDGKRKNKLDFRFSQRIGNDITAMERGIYYYNSIETASGEVLGDSYVHFETLLVKVDGKWVATMEFQKGEATFEQWEALE